MGQLGNLTYRDVTRKLNRLGFRLVRNARGSHEVWRHPDGRKATVANHRGNMDERNVRSILKQAVIDLDEFLQA
jgi:predicted RNA binding protein YcfA (HicA-like mRNA interferase family)